MTVKKFMISEINSFWLYQVREADLKRRQLVIQAMGPSGGKTS